MMDFFIRLKFLAQEKFTIIFTAVDSVDVISGGVGAQVTVISCASLFVQRNSAGQRTRLLKAFSKAWAVCDRPSLLFS
jgi:hypothetical protein